MRRITIQPIALRIILFLVLAFLLQYSVVHYNDLMLPGSTSLYTTSNHTILASAALCYKLQCLNYAPRCYIAWLSVSLNGCMSRLPQSCVLLLLCHNIA